jgi:protein-S-isoprenylcysteine O-methyltransferase Ste14
MTFFKLEILLWTAVAAYWIIAAFFVKKTVKREFGAGRMFYILIWSIACIMLFTNDLPVPFLYKPLLFQDFTWKLAGLILCCMGLLFSVWARIYLGRNWSGNITIKKEHELIVSGPYAITRNPIYSGFLLAFFGCAMTLGQMKGYLSLPFIFLGISMKIRIEEKFMRGMFREKYQTYRDQVKRLIPFFY